MILGMSSYFLALSSTWGCYFIEVDFSLDTASAATIPGNEMGIGLFSFEDTSMDEYTCRAYSDVQLLDFMDTSFRTARVFAILSNLFLGLSMIFFIFLSCCGVSVALIRCVAVIVFMGSICTWLQFSIFASYICDESDCTFFFGAALCLICGIVSMINGCIALHVPASGHDVELDIYSESGPKLRVIPRFLYERNARGEGPPPPPTSSAVAPEDANPGTPVVKEKVLPNGTKVVTKAVRTPEGQRVVEETMTPNAERGIFDQAVSQSRSGSGQFSPPKAMSDEYDDEVGVPVLTEKVLPDGRTKILKTIKNKDGTQTVQETIIGY